MKLYTLRGNELKSINITPYIIDWDRAISKPQKAVKDFLFPFFKTDTVLEEFRIPGSKLRIDLFNISRRVVIEVSPPQHFSFSSFLHQGSRLNFKDQVKRDEQKREWAEKNELMFIELRNEHLKNLSVQMFLEKFEIAL